MAKSALSVAFIQIPLRASKMNEDKSSINYDREVPIAIVATPHGSPLPLPPWAEQKPRSILTRNGASAAMWVPQGTLPGTLETNRLIFWEHACERLDSLMVRGMLDAVSFLSQNPHNTHDRKRKLTRAMRHLESASVARRLTNPSPSSLPRVEEEAVAVAVRSPPPLLRPDVAISFPWESVAKWMVGSVPPSTPLLPLRPGLGDVNMPTKYALEQLRDQIRYKAWHDTAHSPLAQVCGGTLWSHGRRQDLSRLLLPKVERASLKASSKHRMVWVARWDAVYHLACTGALVHVEHIGRRRWVSGEGIDQLTVQPAIKMLPTTVHDPLGAAVLAGDRIIVVMFADSHTASLIYESLKRCCDSLTATGATPPPAQDVTPHTLHVSSTEGGLLMRAWLGLSVPLHSAAQTLLGASRERQQLMDNAEAAFNIQFTAEQKELLLSVTKHITVWNLFAGAGKTLMLMGLAHMCVQHCDNALVWLVAPSNRMVTELYAAVRSYFPDESVLQLQVQSQGSELVDAGMVWLERMVAHAAREALAVVSAVDNVICLLRADAVDSVRLDAKVFPEGDCRCLLLGLFADRHELLEQSYYAPLAGVQLDSLAKIKLVVATTATLRKLAAHVSVWSQWLPSPRPLLLLRDEVALESFEAVAAELAPFQLVVACGQEGQSPLQNKGLRDSRMPELGWASSREKLSSSAFQWHGAVAWARSVHGISTAVDVRTGWEQMRYGLRTVKVIRAVFPDYESLKCRRLSCHNRTRVFYTNIVMCDKLQTCRVFRCALTMCLHVDTTKNRHFQKSIAHCNVRPAPDLPCFWLCLNSCAYMLPQTKLDIRYQLRMAVESKLNLSMREQCH